MRRHVWEADKDASLQPEARCGLTTNHNLEIVEVLCSLGVRAVTAPPSCRINVAENICCVRELDFAFW